MAAHAGTKGYVRLNQMYLTGTNPPFGRPKYDFLARCDCRSREELIVIGNWSEGGVKSVNNTGINELLNPLRIEGAYVTNKRIYNGQSICAALTFQRLKVHKVSTLKRLNHEQHFHK